jgi:hypothetical protein
LDVVLLLVAGMSLVVALVLSVEDNEGRGCLDSNRVHIAGHLNQVYS